ncbi:MAG: hypothetical protein BWY79_01375 [Actinobacteria bacterium ADurb.Bin444]|nr:MAG: hypothetical protein BWY79_01375 [Actinobacteria bacterium ADurb.Bin444]
MVHLVAFLEAPQYGDGVLHRGLAHQHRLETALECGVLLHVLAVLVKGSGTHHSQLAPSQQWFEHVGGIDRALGGPGPHQRVHLVYEGDDLPFGARYLFEHCLEALFKLTSVLGSCHHGANVQPHHLLVPQAFRHVTRDDALCQSFHYGRLAYARFPDEHGVVLGAPREYLYHATDFIVSANDRVEFAARGQLSEVPPEALQSLVLVFRIGILCPLGSAKILEHSEDALS